MTLTRAYVTKGPEADSRVKNDFYPTAPIATLSLIYNSSLPPTLWEPAAGRGHISKVLMESGFSVQSSDLFEYGSPLVPIETGVDYLAAPPRNVGGIVTNPPYKYDLPEKFIRKTFDDGVPYLAMFLRLTFLESKKRYRLFSELPPSEVLVLSRRTHCDESLFHVNHGLGGMVAYGWYVWDYRYTGPRQTQTVLKLVMPDDYVEKLK